MVQKWCIVSLMWLENLAMAPRPDFLCESWFFLYFAEQFYVQWRLTLLWCAGLWAEVCIFALPPTLRGCCAHTDRLIFLFFTLLQLFFLMYLHFLLCVYCQPCSTVSESGISRVQEGTVLDSTLLNGTSPTGFWAELDRWGRKIWF